GVSPALSPGPTGAGSDRRRSGVGSRRLPRGNDDRGSNHRGIGVPFRRSVNNTTSRLANSERLDPRRSGFSRWAPLVFFAFVLIGPTFSPDAGPQDWVLA